MSRLAIVLTNFALADLSCLRRGGACFPLAWTHQQEVGTMGQIRRTGRGGTLARQMLAATAVFRFALADQTGCIRSGQESADETSPDCVESFKGKEASSKLNRINWRINKLHLVIQTGIAKKKWLSVKMFQSIMRFKGLTPDILFSEINLVLFFSRLYCLDYHRGLCFYAS